MKTVLWIKACLRTAVLRKDREAGMLLWNCGGKELCHFHSRMPVSSSSLPGSALHCSWLPLPLSSSLSLSLFLPLSFFLNVTVAAELRAMPRVQSSQINITSFLSIRTYLFPSSYCMSEWIPSAFRTRLQRDPTTATDARGDGGGERNHLRFRLWVKYDGVLPWVITDESGM